MNHKSYSTGNSRRSALAALLVIGACCAVAPVRAAPYPTKPITLVVPFAAGGPVDIVARAIAQPLGVQLGKPVVVENVGGASGMIGAAKVARSQPDGYTLLLGTAGTQALNPNVYAKVPYRSPEDFQPIAEVASIPSVLSVPTGSPHKTIQQFVSFITKNPGSVTMGNAGPGSVSNLAALTFLASVKAKITPVSYKGTAPAFVDLMGGQIDSLFDTTMQAVPQIKGGRVRALATTSPSRLPSLPDVPTLAESGYPNTELLIWYGLLAPAGLPGDVLKTLSDAARKARADAQFNKAMRDGDALVPPENQGSAEFAERVQRDVRRFGELVKQAGITKGSE